VQNKSVQITEIPLRRRAFLFSEAQQISSPMSTGG